MKVLRAARSVLSLAAIVLWLGIVGTLVLYLALVPAVWLAPGRRKASVAAFMKLMSGGIFALLRLGGARVRRRGRLPTERPILVLMNHQSLLDITTVVMMSRPYVPAFVTRRRYGRLIPIISPTVRLLGCPVIDPKRAPRAALEIIAQAARAGETSLLIFPEGHRSLNGSIQPFRTGGAVAALQAARMPVWLAVTDGFWTSPRLVDFVLNVHRIEGRTEVLGPFEPPAADQELPAFLSGLRDRMIEHLEEMRRRDVNGS